MFNGKKILALIPARGGSKGIKGKNIYPLNGKPLISYTISAAKECDYIDEIIVSTDSNEIAEVAKEYGASVPFFRPAYLSSDTAKTIDAVLHAVSWTKENGYNYNVVVLLQPTSPLRSGEDIKKSIELFFENGEVPVVSVCEVQEHPILIRSIKDGKLIKLLNISSTVRRQDFDTFYRVNGSIYINKACDLDKNTSLNDNEIPYIMPLERSVDIDTLVDMKIAEIYLKENKMGK